MTKKHNNAPKERGCWLTGWLILMEADDPAALDGLLDASAYRALIG